MYKPRNTNHNGQLALNFFTSGQTLSTLHTNNYVLLARFARWHVSTFGWVFAFPFWIIRLPVLLLQKPMHPTLFLNFARSSYDLLQFFYFVNSLNLPQSMTKHSFVVLRLSRYFLSHAQPQPYVLLQGYIICNPLQKRDISILYVAKIKEKRKDKTPRWVTALVREFTRSGRY